MPDGFQGGEGEGGEGEEQGGAHEDGVTLPTQPVHRGSAGVRPT